MSLFRVEVGVATSRPPTRHGTVFVQVEAETGYQAELIACQIAEASPSVVMAVSSVVTDWEE